MSMEPRESESILNSTDTLATTIKCSHCDGDAQLVRMQPAGPGYEKRMFECTGCQQQTVLTIQA